MTFYHLADGWSAALDSATNTLTGTEPSLKDRRCDTMMALLDFAIHRFRRSSLLSDDKLTPAIADGIRAVERIDTHAESPIERALAPWLVFDTWPGFKELPAEVHCPHEDLFSFERSPFIVPQFTFLKFRLDFALVAKKNGGLYVVGLECDGADYHRDVAADQKRDGYLASWGIPVIRASGEQIYTEPEKVSGKAYSMLIEIMG